MSIFGIALRNVWRNKFRVVLTILGVAVAIVAFVALRTVIDAWEVGVEYAAKDRIGTRHKVSFVMDMPRRYIDVVRDVPGVEAATWANWFGGQDPNDENNFFATLAVDPESYLQVYDEISIPADVRERWIQDRQGAILGDVLARRLGVEAGDEVRLEGTIHPGTWVFHVAGIYRATRRSVDRSQFLFHWDYLNDWEGLAEGQRDRIGWMVSRIDDPTKAAEVSTAIDRRFEAEDAQTLSMSERAMNNSFMAMFSELLFAMNIVSIVIMLILLLLIGNTIAMGVRERTNEYGVLRALGFLPRHVASFILSESVAIGAIAGVVGLGLAYPLVELLIGRWLEENMGGFFPYFRITLPTATAAMVLAVLLGGLAAAIPAFLASRRTIVDALRRVD